VISSEQLGDYGQYGEDENMLKIVGYLCLALLGFGALIRFIDTDSSTFTENQTRIWATSPVSTAYHSYSKVDAIGTLENVSEYRLYDGAVYQPVDSRTAATLGVSAAKNIPFTGSWICISSPKETSDCKTIVTEEVGASTGKFNKCFRNVVFLPPSSGPQLVLTRICTGETSLYVQKTWTVFIGMTAFQAEREIVWRGGRNVCDVLNVREPQWYTISGERHAVCKVIEGRWEGRQ
jgi:hypothetical protein